MARLIFLSPLPVRKCLFSTSPLLSQALPPSLLPGPPPSLHQASYSYRPISPVAPSEIPARDRFINFGKHSGRMLGSLPSSYLSWMSKNLRAGDFLDWARLADEVLADPIYRDRLEWESAERLLAGAAGYHRPSDSPVADLLSMSETFGWNNDDKEGWARVDFQLLGTSMSGRIPRRSSEVLKDHELVRKAGVFTVEDKVRRGTEGRREMRREKRMIRREKLRKEEEEKKSGDRMLVEKKRDLGDKDLGRFENPFPGRVSLLEKVKTEGA